MKKVSKCCYNGNMLLDLTVAESQNLNRERASNVGLCFIVLVNTWSQHIEKGNMEPRMGMLLYKQNLRGISSQHSPYRSRKWGASDILEKSNS